MSTESRSAQGPIPLLIADLSMWDEGRAGTLHSVTVVCDGSEDLPAALAPWDWVYKAGVGC